MGKAKIQEQEASISFHQKFQWFLLICFLIPRVFMNIMCQLLLKKVTDVSFKILESESGRKSVRKAPTFQENVKCFSALRIKHLLPTHPLEKQLFTIFFLISLDALKSSSLILNVLLLSYYKRKLSVYFKWQRPIIQKHYSCHSHQIYSEFGYPPTLSPAN